MHLDRMRAALTVALFAGILLHDPADARSAPPSPGGAVTFEHRAALLPHGDPIGIWGEYFGADVSVSGDLAVVGGPGTRMAHVFVRSQGAWTEQQRLNGGSGEAFGTSVAIWGDTVVVGSPPDTSVPTPAPAAIYVFVRSGSTWVQQQKLQPPGVASTFGGSVALVGDTLVAGDGLDASFKGCVRVFERVGSTWGPPQKITAGNGVSNDHFGSSVALAADGNTMAVGALGRSGFAGAAYVFERSGGSWVERQMVEPTGFGSEYRFGNAISLSDDTMAVGAYAADTPGGSDAGAVHVFVRSAGVWSPQQRLLADDGVGGANLGRSVAVAGDTVVAGAAASFGSPPGAAYVFVRSGTTWTQQQKLVGLGSSFGGTDHFGWGVALVGDSALVTAPFEDYRGSTYEFTRTGSTWSLLQRIKATTDSAGSSLFGSAVATSETTLAVGAPFDDSPVNTDTGSVGVYVRSGPDIVEQQKIFAQAPADDYFGDAVALSGDTLLVGAWATDDGPLYTLGAAYVFVRSGGAWSVQQRLVAPDPIAGLGFGVAVALDGNTAVIGTNVPWGGAYVFERTGTTWTFAQKLTVPNQNGLGSALALEGDTLLVGDKYMSAGANQNGAAFVFTRSGSVWTQQGPMLMASDAGVLGRFGHSVALSGDTAVVGCERLLSGSCQPGAAYVFVRSGATWTEQQKLTPSDAALGFGNSVAVRGDLVVVGAPSAASPGAYVFTRSGVTWTEQQKLLAPGNPPLGNAMALANGMLVVGAELDGGYRGSAHVFDLPADLSISKTDDVPTAVPGEPITYTIRVANAGPNPTTASVDDVVPGLIIGATWTCSASAGSSCTPAGSGSIHDTVSLLAGGSAAYALVGTIAPGATGTLTNTATVAAAPGTYEPNLADNSALDSNALTPLADLGVTVTESTDPVSQGSPLSYALAVTNAGPSEGRSVQLIGTLPAGVTFVSSTPGPPTCTHATGTLTCDLSVLSPAGGTDVTIDVTVTAGAGVLVANASVSGEDDDPALSNNQVTVATAVGRHEGELSHGASTVRDLGPSSGGDGEDRFRIVQSPFASFEVVVDGTSGDIGRDDGPLLQRMAPDGTTVLQDSVPAGAGPSRSLRWMNATSAIGEGETIRVRSAGCTTDCGADDVYRIRAYETTLSVPRFNNAGTQVTVLVLQNPGDSVISGQARFRLASGAIAAAHAFTLGARETLVLDSSSLPGAAGVAGAITIIHDGPYGGLTGKSVALEPATGFSFDSPAVARPR